MRRRTMGPAGIAVALACVAGAGAGPDRAGGRRPDVLVILADQWNPRYVGWDHPQVRTPNLDAIAREGMVFDACYTPSPVCVPARVSLLTGLYPHNHGHAVWGNPNDHHLDPAVAPLFRDIRRAGYTTAQIGKMHWWVGTDWKAAFDSLDDYHRAMGLDTAVSISGPPDSAAGHDPYCRHLAGLGLLDAVARDIRGRLLAWQYEPRAGVVPAADYHDTFVAGLAADFIRRQPTNKPFCLVASFHSPHPPLDAPGEYATMFDPERIDLPANVPGRFAHDGRTLERADVRRLAANYLGKIALADACVGRLVETLKERGTWDSTLVIFTADHGEMMGAHGALSKGRFWEESARVPLVVRWPGRVKAGRTGALAQSFDAGPTILEAIGGAQTPGGFSRSLLPVAAGQAASARDFVLSEIGKTPPLGFMLRAGRFKWWVDRGGEYLFDIEADPLEMTNLAAAASAAVLQDLRGRMLTAMRTTQVNLAEGGRSKVQRLREADEGRRDE